MRIDLNNWQKYLRDERGSVESALVLVPLLTLFLVGMQISIAIHGRDIARVEAQDKANLRAISGDFLASDSFVTIHSGDGLRTLLVVRKESSLPRTLINSPLFSGRRSVDVDGLAIVEGGQ